MTKIVVTAVIVLIIAAIVIPRVRGRRSAAQRIRAMTDLAKGQGWTFTAENEDLVPLVQRLPRAVGEVRDRVTSAVMRMEPPRLGVGSRILNVLDGDIEGRRILIFDWLAGHGTGAGKAQLVYLHTVWAFPLPHVPYWVQAANMWQPHDQWRPGQRFNTGDGAFDKKFITTAEDGGHVAAGLSPATRRMLLESGFDGWRLDSDIQMLLVWTHSRRHYAPVEQIVPMTHQATRLAAEAIAPTLG